jgi:hypothetical protein
MATATDATTAASAFRLPSFDRAQAAGTAATQLHKAAQLVHDHGARVVSPRTRDQVAGLIDRGADILDNAASPVHDRLLDPRKEFAGLLRDVRDLAVGHFAASHPRSEASSSRPRGGGDARTAHDSSPSSGPRFTHAMGVLGDGMTIVQSLRYARQAHGFEKLVALVPAAEAGIHLAGKLGVDLAKFGAAA